MPLYPYRFEHPKTEQSITLGRKSYLWAGLFGVAYVAYVGYGNRLKALGINLAFAVGLVILAGITSTRYVTPFVQFMVLAVALPVIVFIQGELMISIIRTGFRRRGWMTRSAD